MSHCCDSLRSIFFPCKWIILSVEYSPLFFFFIIYYSFQTKNSFQSIDTLLKTIFFTRSVDSIWANFQVSPTIDRIISFQMSFPIRNFVCNPKHSLWLKFSPKISEKLKQLQNPLLAVIHSNVDSICVPCKSFSPKSSQCADEKCRYSTSTGLFVIPRKWPLYDRTVCVCSHQQSDVRLRLSTGFTQAHDCCARFAQTNFSAQSLSNDPKLCLICFPNTFQMLSINWFYATFARHWFELFPNFNSNAPKCPWIF